MIQETYQEAMRFAGEKHAGQQVPGTTANYLLHISCVAMEVLQAHREEPDFDLPFAIIVAILHDTLEDTETSPEELEQRFGSQVRDAVQSLTKDGSVTGKKERMADSLKRILGQPKEVAIVKIADRITNLQEPPDYWTAEKRAAYLEEAGEIAMTLSGKHAFLDKRIRQKIDNYRTFIQMRFP
jgi:(p)ppGpp synthase/HD superfamily hydrolase